MNNKDYLFKSDPYGDTQNYKKNEPLPHIYQKGKVN
jgi:hypothetical protein